MFRSFWRKLNHSPTHFPQAGENFHYTRKQINEFEELMEEIRSRGFDPSYWHAMNSAAIFSEDPETGNMVRPGITLYGYSPDPELEVRGLEPVMQVKCKMADYKLLDPGHGISYGRVFTPEKPTWVGVLPLGYADGYSRLFSNKAHVLKHGEKREVLGNVCMDMTIIRCREDDDPEETVTIMGRDGSEVLWADTLAQWHNTISYEILSGFSPRLPRLYFKDNKLIAQKSERGVERFPGSPERESRQG